MKSKTSTRRKGVNVQTAVIRDLIDNCDCTDRPDAWRKALAAADRESAVMLVSTGVLAESAEFDSAIQQVAEEGFSYDALDQHLGLAMIEAKVGDDVDSLIIQTEEAKSLGAYALGLAVGIRLAGGAR